MAPWPPKGVPKGGRKREQKQDPKTGAPGRFWGPIFGLSGALLEPFWGPIFGTGLTCSVSLAYFSRIEKRPKKHYFPDPPKIDEVGPDVAFI